MFDGLKGMAGLAGIMKDLPRIKAKMEEVKSRLGNTRVDAEAGGGAVRAVADGKLRLVSIEIDQPLLTALMDINNEADRAMASDLIVGAVNAAMEKAREAAEREFSAAAEELDLPIPPGGIQGLLG